MDSNINVYIFSVAGLISSGFMKCLQKEIRYPLTGSNMLFGLAVGLFGYAFQYTMVESFRLEKNTNIVAVISSSSLLMSYLLDVFFLGTSFTWPSLVGSVLVFSCVTFIILYQKKIN